jgi:hypothetical protein
LAGAFFGAAFFGAGFLAGAAFFSGGIGIVMPPWPACCATAGAECKAIARALVQNATLNNFIGFFPAIE